MNEVPAVNPPVWNPREWYVACFSHELGRRPIARTVLDKPMVLFRDQAGLASALEDRCPHRSAELSRGAVVEGTIECPYHGWRFDRDGRCLRIPGIEGRVPARGDGTSAYPCREADGYVWVYPTPGAEPAHEPFDTTHDLPGYAVYRKRFVFEATLEAVVENFADPMHTGYAHRGLFRGTPTHGREVKVHVERTARTVWWTFEGRPPFRGLVAALLGAGGANMEQRMEFHVPGINRGDVRIGRAFHGITTSLHTPVGPYLVHTYGEFRYKSPLPAVIGSVLARPFVVQIMAQDGVMLRSQITNVQRYGEQYRSTEADTFGLMARQLLRRWAAGEPPSDQPTTRDFSLWL